MEIKKRYKGILEMYFENHEELFDILDSKRFFSLPASTKYHSCVKGGLSLHSLYVYQKAMELKPIIAPQIPDKEVAIVTLFHDLNKLYAGYTPNEKKDGVLHKTLPYKRNSFIADYDSLSCYLCTDLLGISLSPRMYNAIANHNIFHASYFPALHNTCKKHPMDYALVLLLQMSDLYCSQILEVN